MKALLIVVGLVGGGVALGDKPNFLFLLSDDQDWTGLSVETHPDLPGTKSVVMQTPSIAKLANEGMRFSAAYAPSPVCSPTRISIQTGMSPAQLHWTKAAPTFGATAGYKLVAPTLRKSIRRDETTIAELLKSAGYATAHYGKWHINGGGPEQHGYDASDGETGNGDAAPYKGDNPVDIFGMGESGQWPSWRRARRLESRSISRCPTTLSTTRRTRIPKPLQSMRNSAAERMLAGPPLLKI